MKRLFVLALLVAAACGASAQVVDAGVCDVLKNPKAFDGKMVRIKGTVVTGLDQFAINNDDCGLDVNGIWLSYPEGVKAKSGPIEMVQIEPAHNFGGTVTPVHRAPVTFTKDKAFKQFDSALAQRHTKTGGMCLGCPRYTVEATLVGRIDAVADASLTRDGTGKIVGLGGFGNLNAYPARMVLASVTDVTPKEIDYSKADAETKVDTSQAQQQDQGYFDMFAVSGKVAAAMGSSALGQQAQKDAAVFPKGKEQNGVTVGYGGINEVGASEHAAGPGDSPDGVLYVCTMERDRLSQTEQVPALLHMGQHISDLRTPPPGNESAPAMILENNAWVVTTDSAIVAGAKFVTLPGGYVMWDPAWPEAERIDNMTKALNDFLTNEAHLSK